MPQLDTVYILITFLWSWLTIYLIGRKIKTHLMITNPTKCPMLNKPTPPLWL